MRRSILVLVIVTVVIMLAMVAPALAKTGTKSGGYWAYSTGAQSFGADIHGHFYPYPEHGDTNVATQDTPHAGYYTTTGKCKMCHAVHGAGMTDTAQTAVTTEKLLRSTASGACEFCHLDTGFAVDPYAGGGHSSTMNYNGNENNTAFPWGAADVARSGHFKTHGHDNNERLNPTVKSYKGCVSCHSVHGANTMGAGENILKEDPAKGVTNSFGWVVNAGVVTTSTASTAFGSKAGPVTTQAEFCEDCHDGTKLVAANGSVAKTIVSQADFNKAFDSCGASTTGTLCHNSVQTSIYESVAQFGAFNNKMHDGRSHIMTTGGQFGATGVDVETIFASGNGCATCHDVQKYNRSIGGQQGATFPHFGLTKTATDGFADDTPTNELITHYDDITAADGPCLKCHGGVGTQY